MDSPHYRRIADTLRRALDAGALLPGDRMISARRLAAREAVSLPTAVEALRLLECEGRIVARPRSGWFVARPSGDPPAASRSAAGPRAPTLSGIVRTLFSEPARPIVPFGAALPDPALLPLADLERRLQAATRRLGAAAQTYSLPPGRLDLRRRIALAATEIGCPLAPDEILVTSGTTEALNLALEVTTRPGDVVAVESPVYFGTLLALERLGLRALEIATDPETGLGVTALRAALDTTAVAAVVVSPTVQNPTGAIMPLASRRELVALLAERGIPLIEDDVWGDLADEPRPPPAKAFDRDGGVLYCSSVSKTLAPGWRVGWLAAGRWQEAARTRRFAAAWSGSPALEAAIAAHLASGDHERHLRRLRAALAESRTALAARVEASFPQGTRVSRPAAGGLLWIELPQPVDGLAVHARALAAGIGVSPGRLFSTGPAFSGFIRLNAANRVDRRRLDAIDRLGAIVATLANEAEEGHGFGA